MPSSELNLSNQFKILAWPGMGVKQQNPYTWLLYSHMPCQVDDFSLHRAFLGRYDILHVHWPEQDLNSCSTAMYAFYRLRRRFVAFDFMRFRGTKLFWTVHNLTSHERPHQRLERWFWRELLARVDGYIALTESGRTAAMDRFPSLQNTPGFVVPHPHYREAYPENPEVDARATLGLARNAKVVLCFGQIRRYKNIPFLIDVFRQCCDPDAILYIAGRPHVDLALCDEIRSRALGDSRIHINIAEIPNEQVYLYFKAANLVVLPYRDVLNERNMFNSGVALAALSFNRPILVPNQEAMMELADQVGREWALTFDNFTLTELEMGIKWAFDHPKPSVAPLDHLDPELLAAQTLDAYQCVISRGHSLHAAEKSRL